jgi:hypothetical protein
MNDLELINFVASRNHLRFNVSDGLLPPNAAGPPAAASERN